MKGLFLIDPCKDVKLVWLEAGSFVIGSLLMFNVYHVYYLSFCISAC